MKKLFFAVFALVALSLIAPSTGFAQGAHNELGWYTDAEMSAVTIYATAFTLVDVYLIVRNPYNENEGRPMEALQGIEFAYNLPTQIVVSTLWANPNNMIDVLFPDWEHQIGWGVPVLVVGNAVQVCVKSVFLVDETPTFVHLLPISSGPTFPGGMALLDADPGSGDGLAEMFPSSGDFANPVFGFNVDPSEVVATESTTFDGLKALYR